MFTSHVRFRDVKPYETVDSLVDLQGPAHGTVTLPLRVFWSGERRSFDLDDASQRAQVYRAVLSNGRREHLIAFLHRDRLVEDWPGLALDSRIVDLWVSRHPELAEPSTARP